MKFRPVDLHCRSPVQEGIFPVIGARRSTTSAMAEGIASPESHRTPRRHMRCWRVERGLKVLAQIGSSTEAEVAGCKRRNRGD